MRVFVDIGWMQDRLDGAFLEALAYIMREGGASLDLRVAIDGTDLQAALAIRAALGPSVPENGVSAYALPTGAAERTGHIEAIVQEMRMRHAEALMPDVALTIRGVGGESLPPQVPVVNWIPEKSEGLIDALRAAVGAPPGQPDGEGAIDAIMAIIADDGLSTSLEEVCDCLIRSARLGAEPGPPRLLIDVSYITNVDHGTGIQRVVRRVTEKLLEVGKGRRFARVDLVAAQGPDWSELRHVAQIGGAAGDLVLPRTGDTLLMLDAAWEAYPHLVSRLDLTRVHGGRVITAIYDIIPLRCPELMADTLPPIFERWFRSAIVSSDALICISKAVAEDVAAFICENDIPRRDGLRIGWWHLGSDLSSRLEETPSTEVKVFTSGEVKTFLMVGTVEPRKRHAAALDAIEQLWDRGREAKLMILGREGWNVADLIRRMREHPEAGKRLLWKAEASDADLDHAYSHAAALIFPSLSEGYGLPIVEAARLGLGTIASDIPVLREVGGKGTIYVPVDDLEALSHAMANVLDGHAPNASSVRTICWEESVDQLLEILDDDRYHQVVRARSTGGA